MNNLELDIAGRIYTDKDTLERFSRDASPYRIMPQLVVEPAGEEDVLGVIEFARKTGKKLTCRAGGSGLSGAGVGSGIILNFKPSMNKIKRSGKKMVVEPGVVLEDLLQKIRERGLMLPSVPSSSAWCAVGGNVGTRSTGPRTARYGTIDSFVKSLRFITAAGDVVDTEKKLPAYIENGLNRIRKRFLADRKAPRLFQKRPFIAGGYNIGSLSSYEDPGKIAAHLMVGSIGTLGIVTEIRLNLIDFRPSRGTFAAFFRNFDDLGAAVGSVKELYPAAVEFIDGATLTKINGRLLNARKQDFAGVLLIEFDESEEQAEQGRKILKSCGVDKLMTFSVGSRDEQHLWEERRRILPSLWAYAKRRGWIVPSVIDDIAIHIDDFTSVYKELQSLMSEMKHEISIFGHVGFGSIHARPFFEPERGNVAEQILEASRQTYQMLRKYGGTLVGEHNAGRSRSVYLEMELGESFQYLRQIKTLFDPEDLLNPNTLFDLEPITQNMDLSR